MNDPLSPDLVASHSLINFLNAVEQGRFVALNILSQLDPQRAAPDEIAKSTALLDLILQWREGLWNGKYIISADLKAPRGEEAKIAIQALEARRDELAEVANLVIATFEAPDLQQSAEKLLTLIAQFARYAYSMDNHVRGQIDFWLKNKRDQDAALLRDNLERVEEDVRVANSMIEEFKNANGQFAPGFIDKVRMETRFTAGVLRAQSIDAKSIILAGSEDVAFGDFGFMQLEQGSWQAAGFTALAAAYWNAYDIPVMEASAWKQAGVVEPLLAAKWRTFGFGPDYAPAWLAIGFPPILAFAWARANFDPQTAAKYVDQGVLTPEAITPKE